MYNIYLCFVLFFHRLPFERVCIARISYSWVEACTFPVPGREHPVHILLEYQHCRSEMAGLLTVLQAFLYIIHNDSLCEKQWLGGVANKQEVLASTLTQLCQGTCVLTRNPGWPEIHQPCIYYRFEKSRFTCCWGINIALLHVSLAC